MNQNERTISKLLLIALGLALLISVIQLVTTTLQLRELRKLREFEVQMVQSRESQNAVEAARRPDFRTSLANAIPSTVTLNADRAASITSSGNPLRGKELDIGIRNWVTGPVEYATALHFTVPSGLQNRRVEKAVLKLCYMDAWGTFDKRPVTAHRLTENWSELVTPFTVGRDAAFATNIIGGVNRGWYEWDATSAVRYWAAHPDENFGILLSTEKGDVPDNSLRFASPRFEDDALRPVLEIVSSSR